MSQTPTPPSSDIVGTLNGSATPSHTATSTASISTSTSTTPVTLATGQAVPTAAATANTSGTATNTTSTVTSISPSKATYQELVTLVKDLKNDISTLKGTNHARTFQHMRDELKAYCHALDFNDTVALNKLRGTLDEAKKSQAEETKKLSALWERLSYSKQAGRQVDLRSTIFGCLASEEELAADKLVRRYEQKANARPSYRGERFRNATIHASRRDRSDRKRGSLQDDKCYVCGEPGHFARDCRSKEADKNSTHTKKPRS